MCRFINCTCHHMLLESTKGRKKGRKECEWLGHVEWILHETCWGFSEIHNHNERLTPLLGAYMHMYTKLQTQWHIQCYHIWLNSLYESLLNSQWSNIINISAVVIYFPHVQNGPRAHPVSCKVSPRSFLGVKCGRGVLLTTHPLLVLRSWKCSAIPLCTLWPITLLCFFLLWLC